MTTAEFKEKYPNLAHLEGEALWNAMEDALLAEGGKKPTRTLEDVLRDQKQHPDDWIVEKQGDMTFHFRKDFVEAMKDTFPEDRPLFSNMAIMMPSEGILGADQIAFIPQPPPIACAPGSTMSWPTITTSASFMMHLALLGPRVGPGTFDIFFDTEKYKTQEEAIAANDCVIIDFVRKDGDIYFEAYHTKEPGVLLYERLEIQHFIAHIGIDTRDDQRACRLAQELLFKNK